MGQKKNERKRLGREEMRQLILQRVGLKPKHWSEIAGKDKRRTFVRAAGELIKEGLVKRVRPGYYASGAYLSLEEVTHKIHDVFDKCSFYKTVYLKSVSKQAVIPLTWKQKVGNSEITFEDLVYLEARKRGMKVDREGEAEKI